MTKSSRILLIGSIAAAAALYIYVTYFARYYRIADQERPLYKRFEKLGATFSIDREGHITSIDFEHREHDEPVLASDIRRLADLPRLEYLSLVAGMDDQSLSEIAHVTQLRGLRLPKASGRALKVLGELVRLEYLELLSVNLGNDAVAFLSKLPRLRSLDLLGAKLSPGSLEPVGSVKTLEWLRLGGTNVRGAGLSAINGLPNLRYLDLSFCDVDDAEFASIQPAVQRLTELSLRRTNIGDIAIESLVGAEHLEILDLGGTGVTSGAIVQLRRLPSLKRLALSDLNIGDESYAALLGCRGRTTLELTGTRVSAKIVKALRAGGCKVECAEH